MREGWKCPACHRINSPDLDSCPCSEGGASVPAVPLKPVPPPGTITITAPDLPGVVLYGTGTTTGTAWEGVTFTVTNAAA